MPIPKILPEIADAAWLPDSASERFQTAFLKLRKSIVSEKKPILIAEPDPIDFLARFFAALFSERPIVLTNPAWGKTEWQQALKAIEKFPFSSGEILIPTGGTTGNLRFARHSWKSLSAAAEPFARHFEVNSINNLCVLPLFHISGLIQVVRAINTGGKFVPADWKRLENGEIPQIGDGFFLSLVPVQLRRLIGQPDLLPWLRKAKALLIGGAATPAPLIEKAAKLRLPLSLSYGSTETAAMVSAQKPGNFLTGDRSSGTPLPHAKIEILDDFGQPVPARSEGFVSIKATSLFCGYIPENEKSVSPWSSGDLGHIDEKGNLHIAGRSDSIIITGGEKVLPAEVERALIDSGKISDIIVLGIPDSEWGEAVAAVYTSEKDRSPSELKEALAGKLAPYKIPKKWRSVKEIPRTAHGKIDRKAIDELFQ